MTADELLLIYADRFGKSRRTADYIRYLHYVDPKLWTSEALEEEFGLVRQSVSNILRKPIIERRVNGERRKKQ